MTKCPDCRVTYTDVAGEPHVCTPEALKAEAVRLRELFDMTVKFMHTKFAWSFTLDDGVGVKVEFHATDKLHPEHIKAFARIFSAVADNYVTPETPTD